MSIESSAQVPVMVEQGPRANKLHEILATSLKQTLRVCSIEKLASCFPDLALNDPKILQHARDQVIDFLTSACQSEFDKIITERQVTQRLNGLDQLITDAKRKKESGTPSMDNPSDLSPGLLLRAHLLPVKRAELTRLNAQIVTLQQSNAQSLVAMEQDKTSIDIHTESLKQALQTLQLTVEAV